MEEWFKIIAIVLYLLFITYSFMYMFLRFRNEDFSNAIFLKTAGIVTIFYVLVAMMVIPMVFILES